MAFRVVKKRIQEISTALQSTQENVNVWWKSGQTSDSLVGEPVKELSDLTDSFGFQHKLGRATEPRAARTPMLEVDSEKRIGRSLFNRLQRGSIFWQAQEARETNQPFTRIFTPELRQKFRLYDQFDRQFLSQKEYTVSTKFGEQKAYGNVFDLGPFLDPNNPKNEKLIENNKKPPIFIIPAFCADLYGIEATIRELALSGRRVISIAYPESEQGTMSSVYADWVLAKNDFSTQAAFFEAALAQMKQSFPNDKSVEIWGYSTGAIVASTMIQKPEIQAQTERLVLLCPAGIVNQTAKQFWTGAILQEPRSYFQFQDRGNFSDINIVMGLKQKREGGNEMRNKIVSKTFRMVAKHQKVYDTLPSQVPTVVVAGQQDMVTRGNRADEIFKKEPHIKLISHEKGGHLLPLVRAEEVIKLVN